MPPRTLVLLAVLAGCAPASAGDAPPPSDRVRHHMRQRFDDVRTIERMLVAGQLEEARTLAFMLTRPLAGAPQTKASRDLALAAGALANARTIDEAIHAEVRVAIACAQCHTSVQKLPVFRTPSHAPPDRPTLEAQMARHQWAADRLWEGIVGASDEHWRAGLYVMATAVSGPPEPELATRLQQLARAALDMPDTTLDARGARYAELLVTCAGCHAHARRAQQLASSRAK